MNAHDENQDQEHDQDNGAQKPAKTSTVKPELHPREDATHGDEGVDDPVPNTPEEATETTTTLDGEIANEGGAVEEDDDAVE